MTSAHKAHRDLPPLPKAPRGRQGFGGPAAQKGICLLYTSDAADD